MVEQICSFEVVEGMSDEEIKGRNVHGAPVIFVEFDDEKMMKNVVADVGREIVFIKEDYVFLRKTRARKRRVKSFESPR